MHRSGERIDGLVASARLAAHLEVQRPCAHVIDHRVETHLGRTQTARSVFRLLHGRCADLRRERVVDPRDPREERRRARRRALHRVPLREDAREQRRVTELAGHLDVERALPERGEAFEARLEHRTDRPKVRADERVEQRREPSRRVVGEHRVEQCRHLREVPCHHGGK